MDTTFKTASFGGYDKKAVDAYIEETTLAHQKEVDDLKANVVKLSETVKSLHTMREVNLNESSSTIDNLKKVNDELQREVDRLKKELDFYRQKENESASRYESISRTLLEARENADRLLQDTNKVCEEKRAKVEADCNALVTETENECQRMANETTESCEKLTTETVAKCQEMKESTFANCEAEKRQTREELETLKNETENYCNGLKEETERGCKELSDQTILECEDMKTQARNDAYSVRMNVKKECESLANYMSQLMIAVDHVVTACGETKQIADQAFPGLMDQQQ